jgi:hypothetical protein
VKWQKSLFVVMLASMAVFAVTGCGKAEESVPAAEQPSPAVEQTTPAPGSTMPTPPEGGVPGERPPARAMDLATAAAKLGVTELQLSEALGDMQPGLPDLATAAAKLGVSEESLREALGLPEGMPPAGGAPPAGSGPIAQGQ